jgi:CspA family cold shock protein
MAGSNSRRAVAQRAQPVEPGQSQYPARLERGPRVFTGTIKKYIADRGFGFVKPDDGGPDVFVHLKAFALGIKPAEGMRVSYDVAPDSKSGKSQAVGVKVLG